MATVTEITRHRIETQGYLGLNDQALTGINLGLRFGPAICMIGALIGTWDASPALLMLLAVVAAAGIFLPAAPLDLLYNLTVARVCNAHPLPATPQPRRFACLLATLCLLAAAAGFWWGRPAIGYLFGGLMVGTPLLLVSTGFCVPSFLYGVLFGKPSCPIVS
ncbi:MAG: DUF4395 family protein [Caldilineaceae bacterium]